MPQCLLHMWFFSGIVLLRIEAVWYLSQVRNNSNVCFVSASTIAKSEMFS